jgi:hypothetical protein
MPTPLDTHATIKRTQSALILEAHMPDLVDQLVAAATSAIKNQRPELSRNPRELRSVTIELPIRTAGQTVRVGDEAECYLQRRIAISDALGVRS